ncbi:Imm32 family immunity protein [Nocardiopsis synnemataformans]|uniref:Imm32 family immunity protein n=1 Tax=Nocardiopsis synnemataformans TaxID=61305 RepID=UPI003EB7B0B8
MSHLVVLPAHRGSQSRERDRHRGECRRTAPPARHLLTLAEDGTRDGTHLHLEEHDGLEEGSVHLVLERCDEE